MVKPLAQFLKSISVYSGATVLGDGSVAFILDVVGIAQHELVVRAKASNEKSDQYSSVSALSKDTENKDFLLFRLNHTGRYAVFLGFVHRLEEFKVSQIQYSGDQRVVQYRNSVLPIISLNEYLGFGKPAPKDNQEMISVIVSQIREHLYGIEVDEILDVLSTAVDPDTSLSDRPGILGNLIAKDEVIVVVDTIRVLKDSLDRLGGVKKTANDNQKDLKSTTASKRVLYVEDTNFFQKYVGSVLESAGF